MIVHARIAILLAAVFVSVASPARAQDYRRAARLLADWRFADADALIAELPENRPETRYLRAEASFLHGRYEEAIQLLDGLDDAALGGSVGELRDLAASTYATVGNYLNRPSPKGYFEFRYAPGKDEVLVDVAGEVLDRAYELLGQELETQPPTPVRIEIVTRPAELAQVSTLTETDIRTTGTIALCKYNKLMVVTPRATLFGYAWLDTLVHEYVHFVVSTKTHDRVPVWLQEGIARFYQNIWRGGELGRLNGIERYLLSRALRENTMITFDAMHPSMAKLPSQEAAVLAYSEVVTMVDHLRESTGASGLRDILKAIAGGTETRAAIAKQADARSWSAVESSWKAALRRKDLKASSSLAGRAKYGAIHFDDGGEKSENVGIDQLGNRAAEKHARLGGLLRSRGLLQAAAIEYEKALTHAGSDNPLVAGKLARTYLSLGQLERAIKLATPLLDADDNDPAPATTVGLANQALRHFDRAAEAFEKALAINPFDPNIRCNLATAYRELGKIGLEKRERDACAALSQ